jgi:hypothetical protein
MKIAGFTIIKNAVLNDYPVVEAISSVLPIVDEMIVLIGDGSDGTEELIKNIQSDKIKIVHSVWDTVTYPHGTVLAAETNKAFDLISSEFDWAFYIQADEAVHEKYYASVIQACQQYKDDLKVEGLLFNVGDSRKWYSKEVRIIRNDKKIRSFRDAQGFRVGKRKLNVKLIDAFIYHYGWVRSPETILAKNTHVKDIWHSGEAVAKLNAAALVHNLKTSIAWSYLRELIHKFGKKE